MKKLTLSSQALAAKKAYCKKWRAKNPDKVIASQNRYWEKKAVNYDVAERAKDLSESGFTQREIAKELNISLGAVNKYLKRA